jgi:predicted membrane protein
VDIKGFIVDHVGHFAMHEILGLVFSMLVASVLAWLLGRFGAGLVGKEARTLVIWSATVALGVGFIKAQLPLALAFVALAALVGSGRDEGRSKAVHAGALVIGLGCGSGAALVTAIAAVPYLLIVRWARAGSDAG